MNIAQRSEHWLIETLIPFARNPHTPDRGAVRTPPAAAPILRWLTHVMIATYLPPRGDQEWVEYGDVRGPDPNPPKPLNRGVPESINVIFVKSLESGGTAKL